LEATDAEAVRGVLEGKFNSGMAPGTREVLDS
jgi:hypothetical protein